MNPSTLAARVAAIANLSDFAARSGVPRRTLTRLIDPDNKASPSLKTVEAVERALARLRPKTIEGKSQLDPEQRQQRREQGAEARKAELELRRQRVAAREAARKARETAAKKTAAPKAASTSTRRRAS